MQNGPTFRSSIEKAIRGATEHGHLEIVEFQKNKENFLIEEFDENS